MFDDVIDIRPADGGTFVTMPHRIVCGEEERSWFVPGDDGPIYAWTDGSYLPDHKCEGVRRAVSTYWDIAHAANTTDWHQIKRIIEAVKPAV